VISECAELSIHSREDIDPTKVLYFPHPQLRVKHRSKVQCPAKHVHRQNTGVLIVRLKSNETKVRFMNAKRLGLAFLFLWLVTAVSSFGATVPAGAKLVVRTNGAISSHATPGNNFSGTLDQTVLTKGSVLLRAGTAVSGVITASRGARSTTRSEPLTLNLTAVSVNGRTVPIKTKNLEPHLAKTTRSSRGAFTFGESILPAGTRLEFHLSQPVNL